MCACGEEQRASSQEALCLVTAAIIGLRRACSDVRHHCLPTMADRRQDYERLKRNKDKAERDAILARMAEDKAEKAERERQKKLIASEEEAATSSAASAYKSATSAATTDTSTLAIRAEEGALRHTFPATTTLAEVREWLLQEQARQQHTRAHAHGHGHGRAHEHE